MTSCCRIFENHHQPLWSIAHLLPEELPDYERVWAAYSEAIAWKVRKGAPLAAYPIDRRAAAGFASSVEGTDIEELVCFSCARRFARLGTGNSEEISWTGILSSSGVVGSQPADVRCLGLTMGQTASMFGLEDCDNNLLGRTSVFLFIDMHKVGGVDRGRARRASW